MSMQFLKGFWYPIVRSRDLPQDRPLATLLLGEPLVLFRDSSGRPVCLHDACPHFGAPLSLGTVQENTIACPYHGWRFGEGGACQRIPSLPEHVPIPRNARCRFAYPACEQSGAVWVWTGDPAAPAPLVPPEGSVEPGWVHEVLVVEQETPHHIMIGGTVDYTHIAFMHTRSIGRRRPVRNPMEIELDRSHRFRMRLKDPESPDGYNDMVFTFEPPCHIQIATRPKPNWRLLANQYVVPLSETRTRLILFLCRDWLTWNPLVSWQLRRFSLQILKEDTPIQIGQYQRHASGDGDWSLPIRPDALSMEYRRWYNERRATAAPRSS